MNKLTKFSRAILAIAIMLCMALPTLAHDFEVDGIYYKYLDKTAKTIAVTYKEYNYDSYDNKYTGAITIPSSVTYKGITYSVALISDFAFSGCTGLTSVVIPNSVTSIGQEAFLGCSGLTSITIPNSVTWIGYGAFIGCTGLTSITIPNFITSIGGFSGCTGLTSITIPNSVTSIGSSAFEGCTSLTSITIPNSVTSIYNSAFEGCTNLTSITIPNSVTSIGYEAFSGCTGLTSITIPNSVTSIGKRAFYGTAWYNNQPDGVIYVGNVLYEYKGTMPNNTSISIKEGTISISPDAFKNCGGLTSVTIPNSVTSIGSSAFEGCTSLTSITIPNSVTSIGYYAFDSTGWYYNQPRGILYLDDCCLGYKGIEPTSALLLKDGTRLIGDDAFSNCYGLTSITIPNSVTSIGEYAFSRCTGLTEVNISDLSAWYKIDFNGINANPLEFAKKLKLNGTEIKDLVIPSDITEIKDYAFSGCHSLTSITIPNSVVAIGDYAFSSCYGLAKLILEDGTDSISGLSFPSSPIETLYLGRNTSDPFVKGKTTLKEVTIGNSVTLIGDEAFFGCTSLTSITIPNFVTSIGNYAFSDCTGLTSITIPNSVTSIGNYAFYNCRGMTSITIPNSVTSIGAYAFYNCRGLTSITIPNSVTSIGKYAFWGCDGLTEVNISDLSAWCKIDFENYDANPLYWAKEFKLNGIEIKDLVIPNDITKIKDYAFSGCTGLSSIIIPISVTSIGNRAFSYCYGLTSIIVEGSNPKYDSRDNCNAIVETSTNTLILGCKNTTIPNSVTSIGSEAFSFCRGLTSFTIPNSVTSIGESAFSYCTGLTELNYNAENCTSMGSSNYPVFGGCSNLKIVNIGSSVKTITDYAFSGCHGLTSITIPNSVTSIGTSAFYDCRDLDTIISLNPTPPACSSSESFYDDLYSSATLYVPKDSFAKYFIDEVWGQFSNLKKIETLISSITLNKSSIELDKGSTATLSATIAPSNATIKNIVWTSSNPQIATVDQSGKVTAFTPGTATITAKSIDGSNVSASCKVTVNSIIPTITLSQIEATLPVNEIMTLSYSITNSATKTATWSTSNENVAYVKTNNDGSATIVGMADGVATITATMVDNGQEYSASCVVTVGVGGVEGVEMDNNAIEIARYDIHGRLLSEPTPGINIVKMSNGTTRKEIVK